MVSQQYELSISSDIENIPKVESLIETICNDLNVKDELYGNILVAITEGVNNAISHGNNGDGSKNVEIKAEESNGTLTFVIKDEGPGFDFENIPDPTAPENLEKPSGRGVFLMRQLADEVSFSQNGSHVEVKFKL